MEPLIIESTTLTPFVNFNPNEGRFEMSGYSRPENIRKFFTPLTNYFDDFLEEIENRQDNDGIRSNGLLFVFRFTYINSVSTKFLCELLLQVMKFKNFGLSITIDWFYEEYDEEMCELGKDLSGIIDHSFNYYTFIS